MAQVVNLRRFRKNKERADAQVAADASRALHGRSREAREADTREAERARTRLDGARREP